MNRTRKALAMIRPALLGLLIGCWIPTPASAQWRIGADLGADRIARMVRSTEAANGEGPDGRPTMTWPLALRVERGGEGVRVAMSGSVVRPGLELIGSAFSVTTRPAFRVLTLGAELSARVARLRNDGSLRLHLSVPAERWSFIGYSDPARWRLGIAGGAAVEVPLAGALSGRFGISVGTLFRHPLSDTGITEEYVTTAVWRESVRAGVVVRL